ncbi:MAG: HAMP domain-containing sensor histidine kinase [Planctomycetota bacterium]|nr:HAMP domain-containing sensor histidine kinase [Planctomycetota bacterium]
MPSAQSKKAVTRSLRFRLMIWNAAVVVVTACVTLVAIREGVRITLIRELDQLLHEDLREIEIALNEHEDATTLHEQLDRKDAGHAQHKWFAGLLGGDGQVRYQSKHAPPASVWATAGEASARTVGEWRLTAHAVPGEGVVIRVGASLDSVHADVARLDRLVALAVCGVLLIAPLCGYWLAGRATRPLARIIETTAGLRPSQLHERLEIRGTGDELDQLSETFNRLLDRIGNYLQERRDFLANSAHELRTPLAAIRSSIEVALTGGRTNEEYEELLADIIEESASLELLVNQLLLLSETETERLKVDKQQVQFNDLVEKAMDMFGGVAEFREIQLVCQALPSVVVYGNQQHLRQVIYNLLDNALKFTPAGGQVKVQLKADNQEEAVVFAVRDSGPGIPEAELPHVFDRFFQGHRPRTGTAEKRGTGLGLSICQAIIRAHDGTIEVNSTIGKGTCFTVRLPRGRDGDNPPPPSKEHDTKLQLT